MRTALLPALLAALAAAPLAHATGTDRLRVDLDKPSQTLTFSSTDKGIARYEVAVLKWTQDSQSPTREVLAYPPVFEVQPGGKQAIKVLSRVPRGPVEGTYRLMIRAIEGGSISFSLPVFVPPTDPGAKPVVAVTRGDEGALRVANTGAVTELITGYRDADGKRSTMLYVLPGSSAELRLPAAGIEALVGRSGAEYRVQ